MSDSRNNDSLPEGIVTDPNQALSEMPLLTDAEKHQLLVEWNDTRIDYPSDKCIHELFETQAAKTPDAIAVVFADQQLTYRELNSRANQLAHYLRKLGVGPETLVGICMERSMEMIVGLLGILKAGGAYVPLDPTYPKERLAFMLEDSRAPFLLTQARLGELRPAFGGTAISLDQDRPDIAQESTVNVGPVQNPETLAYVIYTSGSTGKPKGVMIQHRSVVNFLASMARQPGLCETDTLLAVSNLSFDMTALDIYLALTVGARIVLARREDAADGLRLRNLLSDSGATVMQATPATWRMLLAVGWQGSRELNILCGGEALSEDLAKQLGQHCASLWNMYGPTETTVYSSSELYCRHLSGRTVPIGRPIANTQIYILNQQLQPVPIGVPGELHIGGGGLARGYLNRPELTAEKFIANPFAADTPSRLYKTGDLARYLPGGKIEFLGRMDHQVKIRGYRIELDEIEAVLAQHRSIKESVVIARDDGLGSQRLVAYVVADRASVPSANELRGFLQQTLPEYMVPSAFEFLDALPLTPNGKLDRSALPAPGKGRPKLDETYSPPRTPVEELLAHIWAEVLTLDQVGIHDNFFALGGNSLRAIQMIARLRNVLNQELFLSDIFSSGTIAALANSLTQRTDKAAAVTESIQPIGRHRRLPLSFSQERVWFIEQLYPSNRAYHFQSLLYFTGYLDVDALERSLGEIVRRHEIFRTAFPEIDGDPIQDIHPPFSVSLPVLNLQEMPDDEREAVLQKRITEETRKPFDLNTLPLVRWTLVRLKVDEFVLIHVEHHLVHDGWSFNVFRRELLEIYKAFSAGEPSPLPEPTLQFADFALWQRRWMDGEPAKRQLAYWQRQLRGSPSALALPTDHARPPAPSFRGAAPRYAIPGALGDSLRALSRERGATLFMTMFAVFVALLYRYTQQEDIVVGTAVGNRRWQESEGLIGMLVNNAVLRTNLSENPKFTDLLDQVKGVALEAYANEDIPFDQVVRALDLKRDDSRNPIFQIMFSFHDAPLIEPSLPEVNFKCVEVISNQSAKFDLNVVVIPRREQNPAENSITLIWEYSSDLFEPDTIERMVGHYFRLLEEIIADPSKRISDYAMVNERATQELLQSFNCTRRDYPQSKCVHELFETQVEKAPDAIAVVFEDKQLTYRELNQRANQLAHYLRQQGVQPDTIVALCMERSIEMVVGILGVLKAGGAYQPIDPESPAERQHFLLDDAQADLVLTQDKLRLSFAGRTDEIVCLDSEWYKLSDQSDENLQHQVGGHHAAYVIYTSGSTGTPKGVVNVHSGLLNRLQWMQDAYRLTDVDRVLQKTPLTFDVSVWELLWPLISGACLVVARPGGHRDGAYLVQLIQSQQITTLHFVPSMLEVFLRESEVDRCITLRQVICSGEALSYELQQRFFDRSSAALHNLYGPTEASIDVTAWECRTDSDRSVVPIGRPIANTQIYILDPHLNPVPIGVVGELHIGGMGLARGYLNRRELTAQKFVANPFSDQPGARLYKTGDLARYLPDGNIEFLGRIDNQVKIRGFRIELGEIEAVLGQHPTVQSSVVVVQEDTPGDKRLVAYAVGQQGESFDAAEIRKYLKQKLPEYMIPSAFVLLDEFPLTPNGKVDRKALPAPNQDRPELGNIYQAPRTPVEEALASIWCELLNVDRVGIQDSFFELGGHSLLATQVITRVRNALRVELPLRRFFECPTIHGLAEAISAERQTPQRRRFPAISPASRDGDLPLSFAQQRLWLIDQLEPESSVYNVPGAWRLSGLLDLMALERSVNEIVRRHEVLRTRFVTVDGQPAQHIGPPVSLPLDVIHLAELADGERESAIDLHVREEFRKPFDLARGCPLRAKLLRLAEDDHVLLFTMHHIVSDGWSIGVLFRELSRLYEAFSGDSASPLEDLPIQYADYAVWQRGWLHGEVLESQLVYWRRQLENLTVLQLPTDRRRPSVQRCRGARARVHFDATLTKKLWDLSRGENATLYITLLAAFQILLSRYSGQEDIAVGSPIAGRSTPELEGLIGFFANTLVLRGDLSNNPTFREFLQRIRDVALEAYAHQDLPFEKLVEDLSPRRALNISPLFQVMLVMHNDPREDLDFKGLTTTPVSIDSETAKFDLLLSLRESKFGLRGTLEYDTDLFDATTIDRMLGHFETLLRGIVADPDQRLLQLPLLTDGERHLLLAEWNETTRGYPKHLCVHQLFERQAEKRPDEIAIVFEDRQMTYRELDIRSNQLAHYLRKQGVGTESVVGLCLERSPEMIVAVLAILKVGGAYLPLDPSYPSERLGLMVEQAGASIILTQKRLVPRIPTGETVRRCLDSLAQLLALERQERLSRSSSPENAVYALFTSGSTGVPKGVLLEHRPLVNLLSWQAETFVSAAARTLQFAPLSFDVSFQEIFSALCFGGTLVLIGEAERRDARALWPLLKEKAVERMFLPFIALQQLAEAAQDDAVTIESLREIITAGEQLQVTQSITNLFTRLPNCQLFNQYGPTESHVVTSFKLGGDPADWPDLPPIGRPIANSKIYILDHCLQPVPVGVIGELYIGGDSLAREYLNHPDLSREKFVSNPFIKEPGARLYRTGDLARYLADGNIQFVGRIDDQVKVRGFRVEPGEIEITLCRHTEVLECVISVCEDATEGKRLVAYIVTSAGQHLTSGQLRDYLKEKLPEYMIPNVFVFLDSLPLTASGKVDRRALPAPDGSRSELAEGYTAPRNHTEELLAKIWAEVLNLEKVGIRDNFFNLGGHSLLATQVISRMRNAFSIEVPLRQMFDAPTIAEMETFITENQVKRASAPKLARMLREIDSIEEDAKRRMDEIKSTIAK